ncbi:hypothetical protein [Streptomyces sp. NPDC102437]|uniref:hypothetical protein n=1 Tax=Streptomyces sp. NPDC102437 TaxID=3366175 RepID=UPI003806EC4A
MTALDGSGTPAPPRPRAATTGAAPARCFTATDYAQVAAGRAHTTGGLVYANGSDRDMGLYNVFVTHTRRESPPGHFVIADTGCTA